MIKGRAGVATIAVPEVGSMSGFANLGLKPARPDPPTALSCPFDGKAQV